MMHTIPKEYTHDAKLITLYNTGFKDGYYSNAIGRPILDDQVLTDSERLCYKHGINDGLEKRRNESKTEWKKELKKRIYELDAPSECPFCGGKVSRHGLIVNNGFWVWASCTVCDTILANKRSDEA